MKYISERITNIHEMEDKIIKARAISDFLLQDLSAKKYDNAVYAAKKISLALHELAEFEFTLDKRIAEIENADQMIISG